MYFAASDHVIHMVVSAEGNSSGDYSERASQWRASRIDGGRVRSKVPGFALRETANRAVLKYYEERGLSS